jgi:histidinol-phosphate aminotransferase
MTSVTRRTVLRGLGSGAVAVVASPVLAEATVLPTVTSRGLAGPPRRYDNENAYGPSPLALAALRDAAGSAAHEYPDQRLKHLRSTIASIHNVTVEQVVLGCGSTEILRMAADAFLAPNRPLVMARPSCEVISDFAVARGASVAAIRLSKHHSHDLPAMLAACSRATGLVYICTPNNPTGTVTRRQDLDDFLLRLPTGPAVVIDEAYHQYVADSPESTSFLDRPTRRERVIVVRSFSKIHGLAGLRVGYAITSPDVAAGLVARGVQLGVSGVAAAAAAAAIADRDHVSASVSRNTNDRQEFFNKANARMLRPVDSQTNFVMVDTGRPAAEVIAHFASHGLVLPPPIAHYGTYVRVSLGLPAQMDEFWRVWDLMPRIHSHG